MPWSTQGNAFRGPIKILKSAMLANKKKPEKVVCKKKQTATETETTTETDRDRQRQTSAHREAKRERHRKTETKKHTQRYKGKKTGYLVKTVEAVSVFPNST